MSLDTDTDVNAREVNFHPVPIPQGIALGWKNTVGIWAHTYKHGGGGINFFVGGSRVFAVDYHAFKLNGAVASRLHYHRGLTPATQKLHRPYQGGP